MAGFAAQDLEIVNAPFTDERYGDGMRKGDVEGCEAVHRAIMTMYQDGTAGCCASGSGTAGSSSSGRCRSSRVARYVGARGYRRRVAEDRVAWDELLAAGFLHGVREAHREATLALFRGLSRSAGFKERTYGVGAFELLETHLDRVFGRGELGRHVARDDLNGSPGWRFERYRVLLKRHEFGNVRGIRWDRDSPTKQAVARQGYVEDPQLELPLGIPRDTPGVVTLVLAHSASEEPLEMELFLGRPRWNADGGTAWHWVKQIDDTVGPDPRRKLVERTLPLWDDHADVPMRLRGETKSA